MATIEVIEGPNVDGTWVLNVINKAWDAGWNHFAVAMSRDEIAIIPHGDMGGMMGRHSLIYAFVSTAMMEFNSHKFKKNPQTLTMDQVKETYPKARIIHRNEITRVKIKNGTTGSKMKIVLTSTIPSFWGKQIPEIVDMGFPNNDAMPTYNFMKQHFNDRLEVK